MTRLPAAGELLSIASSDTQRVADAVFMVVFPVAEIASVLYMGIMMLGIAVLIGGPPLAWITLVTAGDRSIDLWSARLRGRA